MKLVQLTKDMPHQGLSEGDVLSVDQRSAKALIERGDATEYEPEKADAGEKVETVDDIQSTARPGGRAPVMSVARVGSADPGPTHAPSKKVAAKKPPAAPGAQPAGGDAGGGAAK